MAKYDKLKTLIDSAKVVQVPTESNNVEIKDNDGFDLDVFTNNPEKGWNGKFLEDENSETGMFVKMENNIKKNLTFAKDVYKITNEL